jgi:hypothetical protein
LNFLKQMRIKCNNHCIRIQFALLLSVIILQFTACTSLYPYRRMDPPWVPAPSASANTDFPIPDENSIVPVYFSETDLPSIDGDFSEWLGLDGPVTHLAVYGGSHDPEDAEAFFVLRTDGKHLFIYARVSDDMPHENFLPGSMAWRGDTVEVFFGDNTLPHDTYLKGDNQIRLVGRSLTEPETDIVVNQRTVGSHLVDRSKGEIFAAHTTYYEKGYEMEVAIPLKLLGIDGLRPGQRVRCDFQVNDADMTERDRLIHWFSPKDTGYFDPSTWGNGRVVELPEERKEEANEL